MQWYLSCTSAKEMSLKRKNLLSAERIVTELRIVLELSTRFSGVICRLSLISSIWNEFSKNAPKNTIRYITMMMITLIVSFMRFNFDEISGGSKYSNSFSFSSCPSSSSLISWAYYSRTTMLSGRSESTDFIYFNWLASLDRSFFSREGESSLIYCERDLFYLSYCYWLYSETSTYLASERMLISLHFGRSSGSWLRHFLIRADMPALMPFLGMAFLAVSKLGSSLVKRKCKMKPKDHTSIFSLSSLSIF